MTPSELTKMIRGKRRALLYEEDWKKTELRVLRWIGALMYNKGLKKTQQRTADKLLPFSFDKELKNGRNSKQHDGGGKRQHGGVHVGHEKGAGIHK